MHIINNLYVYDRHRRAAQVVSDLADLDETKYDVKTLERLKGLVAEKQKCVDVEDYGGAKRCKEAIVMLKRTGARLRFSGSE